MSRGVSGAEYYQQSAPGQSAKSTAGTWRKEASIKHDRSRIKDFALWRGSLNDSEVKLYERQLKRWAEHHIATDSCAVCHKGSHWLWHCFQVKGRFKSDRKIEGRVNSSYVPDSEDDNDFIPKYIDTGSNYSMSPVASEFTALNPFPGAVVVLADNTKIALEQETHGMYRHQVDTHLSTTIAFMFRHWVRHYSVQTVSVQVGSIVLCRTQWVGDFMPRVTTTWYCEPLIAITFYA